MNEEFVNLYETGVTPEDVLKKSHNGMAPRKEYEQIPWKKDEDIYDPADLVGISIVAESPITIQVGDFKKINVIQNPVIANLPELCWESSNIEVAWVSSEGIVYATSEGTTTITVSKPASSISATVTVKVVVGEEPEPEPEKKDAGLEWSAESVTVTSAEDPLPTLTNPNNLTVTYTSGDPDVASITEEGVVTLVDGGVSVISAVFAGNEEYKEDTVSYTLTYNKQ
jgi:hypothetical protein